MLFYFFNILLFHHCFVNLGLVQRSVDFPHSMVDVFFLWLWEAIIRIEKLRLMIDFFYIYMELSKWL